MLCWMANTQKTINLCQTTGNETLSQQTSVEQLNFKKEKEGNYFLLLNLDLH